MLRVHTAGSVGGSTAIVAASLVEAGVHDRVLTAAYEKQSESNAMWALSIKIPFSQAVVAGAGGYFAPLVRAYIRHSGAPEDTGIRVALKDRQNALKSPNLILKEDGSGGILLRPDRLPLCIKCGQCMAICPSQSIALDGLVYSRDFFAPPAGPVTEMPFLEMIKTRRAIRVFKDQPVPRELLEKVVQAIAFPPPGFPPVKTEVVVVQDKSVIRQALPEMIKVYDGLIRAMSNPMARFFIHRKVGEAKFKVLGRHVVPLMKSRLPELRQGTEDTITRYAPAMIIFHAHRDAEN